jgi:putative membrane protein
MIRFTMLSLAALLCAAMQVSSSAAQDKNKMVTDQQFVDDATKGGLAEVKLGELAAERASDPEIRRFGQRIVDDHGAANKELSSLVKNMASITPPSKDLMGKHRDTYDDLSKRSGADFDKTYISDMVADHEKDAKLFESMADNGQDPQLKAFAAKTLPVIKDHLKMARDLATKIGAPMTSSDR